MMFRTVNNMKIKFKYLKKYKTFWHYWSFLFKKRYKYGHISYYWTCWKYNMKTYYDIKVTPLLDKLKVLFQKMTPWLKYQRWLLNQTNANYCKLLWSNMTELYQRTRDCDETYYFLTIAKFGYVRFYEERYICQENGKAVNMFVNIILPALTVSDDEIGEYKFQRKCLVKGFCLTKKQAIKLIRKIKSNAPIITWNNNCNNQFDHHYLLFLMEESKKSNDSFDDLKKYCQNNIIEKFGKSEDLNVTVFIENLRMALKSDERKKVLQSLTYLIHHLTNLEYEFDKKDFYTI